MISDSWLREFWDRVSIDFAGRCGTFPVHVGFNKEDWKVAIRLGNARQAANMKRGAVSQKIDSKQTDARINQCGAIGDLAASAFFRKPLNCLLTQHWSPRWSDPDIGDVEIKSYWARPGACRLILTAAQYEPDECRGVRFLSVAVREKGKIASLLGWAQDTDILLPEKIDNTLKRAGYCLHWLDLRKEAMP